MTTDKDPGVILVTAPTGHIGQHVVRQLAEWGQPTRVLVRDPARYEAPGRTVEVVQGDLDQPATLEPAFRGVSKLFLLSPGPDVPAQDAALVQAAQRARLDHVVMLSSLGAELGGIAGGRPHMPGERLLQESGVPWTILHPSEFMSNTLWWTGSIQAQGAIFAPTGTGRVGFIDPADIAAVAAHVLTTPNHEGRTYRLTGPEALSTADIAERISAVSGKPSRHVDIPEVAFREGMQAAGLPPPMIEMQVEYCAAVKEGRVAILTHDVEELLGRPPRDYATWVQDYRAAFLAEAPATTH
ncbi:MAG: SDR family oxidoreductase [Actinomycetota bacterium]|nr:SDR family oxidoreductase [Actinomycetota bacterium]